MFCSLIIYNIKGTIPRKTKKSRQKRIFFEITALISQFFRHSPDQSNKNSNVPPSVGITENTSAFSILNGMLLPFKVTLCGCFRQPKRITGDALPVNVNLTVALLPSQTASSITRPFQHSIQSGCFFILFQASSWALYYSSGRRRVKIWIPRHF